MPPQHSITAAIRYIPSAAFDISRVSKERASMPRDGDHHPVVLYFAGESRYDLDAPYPVGDDLVSARDYLLPDHTCPEWELRRLRMAQVARCRDAGGRVGQLEAFRLSFVSVRGIEGAPTMGDDQTLTEAQAEKIADVVGLAALYDVGEAALRASEAPKAAEKKP